ncbi:MAG: cysteine desulfurase [Planctomycetes bacterium]|nr:cysteine desulfurase [Planctomycetota bacterium]
MAAPLYLDHNATTPLAPGVLEAMLPFLEQQPFNPSSDTGPALLVRKALETARQQVAQLVGADRPQGIVFTSGGTESIHAAFHHALEDKPPGSSVLITAVEHSATRGAAKLWAARGFPTQVLPVESNGQVPFAALEEALERHRPALVSSILANNETGVIQDVQGWAERIHGAGALGHVDAIQAPGKLSIDAKSLGVDWLSISGHKFGGPKGTGALYQREPRTESTWLAGGGQERGLRGGTENVAGLIGLGWAAQSACARAGSGQDLETLAASRDRLEGGILAGVPGAQVAGAQSPRVSNTTQLLLPECPSEFLLPMVEDEGLLASAGSACDATHHAPSQVLLAMGFPAEQAGCSLRLSLPPEIDPLEVDRAVEIVVQACRLLGGHGD